MGPRGYLYRMAHKTTWHCHNVVMAIQSKWYNADFFQQPNNVGGRAYVFLTIPPKSVAWGSAAGRGWRIARSPTASRGTAARSLEQTWMLDAVGRPTASKWDDIGRAQRGRLKLNRHHIIFVLFVPSSQHPPIPTHDMREDLTRLALGTSLRRSNLWHSSGQHGGRGTLKASCYRRWSHHYRQASSLSPCTATSDGSPMAASTISRRISSRRTWALHRSSLERMRRPPSCER